jgi:penicillin-binding protein 1C
MEFIYPYRDGVVSPTKNWRGEVEPIFFELAHTNEAATVLWHLDEHYLAETNTFHGLSLHVPPGQHLLTVVDNAGNRLEKRFEVK